MSDNARSELVCFQKAGQARLTGGLRLAVCWQPKAKYCGACVGLPSARMSGFAPGSTEFVTGGAGGKPRLWFLGIDELEYRCWVPNMWQMS